MICELAELNFDFENETFWVEFSTVCNMNNKGLTKLKRAANIFKYINVVE